MSRQRRLVHHLFRQLVDRDKVAGCVSKEEVVLGEDQGHRCRQRGWVRGKRDVGEHVLARSLRAKDHRSVVDAGRGDPRERARQRVGVRCVERKVRVTNVAGDLLEGAVLVVRRKGVGKARPADELVDARWCSQDDEPLCLGRRRRRKVLYLQAGNGASLADAEDSPGLRLLAANEAVDQTLVRRLHAHLVDVTVGSAYKHLTSRREVCRVALVAASRGGGRRRRRH
mmetsp:Transcript_14287/g.44972  ORF Transcript_14287/g.44972 Transcript_14287/m.44972 type:complete len:227 (+) Transcript_14287:2389-3069(+)